MDWDGMDRSFLPTTNSNLQKPTRLVAHLATSREIRFAIKFLRGEKGDVFLYLEGYEGVLQTTSSTRASALAPL